METQDKQKETKIRVYDLRHVDLRIGLVTDVHKIRLSEDDVFVLSVDIGKRAEKYAPTRNLIKYYKLGTLVDRKVLLACNLFPIKEGEFEASTKIMCAVAEHRMEVLFPPKSAEPGDRVFAPGMFQDQHWIIKDSLYKSLVKDLRVNHKSQAEYKGVPLQLVEKPGYIVCKTLTDCPIDYS